MFIENIFRSRLTLVSSNDIITIKIDKKKELKNNCQKSQENKRTKKIIQNINLGCKMDIFSQPVPKQLLSLLSNFCYIFQWKFFTDHQNHPSKWTIYEDFKDWICILAEQICIVKTLIGLKWILKNYSTYNTKFSVQLP